MNRVSGKVLLTAHQHTVAPERIWKCGGGGTGPAQKLGAPTRRHLSSAKRRKKIFGRAPPLFGSKSTISRFGERFRDGYYSLASFLFAVLLLTVPPVPSHF